MRGWPAAAWSWGYFIYRTVYTTQSDRVWSEYLEKLDRYVHLEIDRPDGERYSGDDSFPEKLVHETCKNVICEDKERYDGAWIELIRSAFNRLLAESAVVPGDVTPRYAVCLVIDEERSESILASSDDPEESTHGGGPRTSFVVMVDPMYVEGKTYDNMGYRGL